MKKEQKQINKKSTIITVVGAIIVLAITFAISSAINNSNFKEITYDKYLELKASKTEQVVYISSAECSECSALNEKIEALAEDYDVVINYLNLNEISAAEKSELLASDATLDGYTEDKSVLIIVKGNDVTEMISASLTVDKIIGNFKEKGIVENTLIEVTLAQYLEIIKSDETSFMFVGSATCSWCTKFKPELAAVLKEYSSINAYYIDLSKLSTEDLTKLYATDSYFTDEEWGTPLSFLYKDGKRVAVLNGYVEQASLISFFKENEVIK